MERWKQFFAVHFLFPRLAVVLISVPVTAALLLYTFAYGSEISPGDLFGLSVFGLFAAYRLHIHRQNGQGRGMAKAPPQPLHPSLFDGSALSDPRFPISLLGD